MNPILLAVIIVSVIGLIAGIGLAVASVVMAVPKDEKAEAVLEVLPGANCGSCGYSGCSGYAAALAKGEAKVGLCSPGGAECAEAVGKILGVSGSVELKKALVQCVGNYDVTSDKMIYDGLDSCQASALLSGGVSSCRFGCMGLGDCVKVCQYNAIRVCNGVAQVDSSKCVGCGMCIEACPKKLIRFVPVKTQAVVRCSNCDKGAVTNKVCKVGCIGCMKCTKVCDEQAITVTNFNATVDPAKCVGCGKCAEACPRHIIDMIN